MNIHKNARLTPIGREPLVAAMLSGQTPEAAARAVGVARARVQMAGAIQGCRGGWPDPTVPRAHGGSRRTSLPV
jgi:hypothetical protein